MAFRSLDLTLIEFLESRKIHFVIIPPYFNLLPLPHLHLFLYISQTKSNHVISHHLLTFCEIVDSTRIKSERTVGRKSNKSVDVDFLSGPPATCLYIPKLERWKRMNKP